MNTNTTHSHVRAGIFESPEEVENLLPKLRAAGFGADQISVFTSNTEFQERFKPYLDENFQLPEDQNRMQKAGEVGLGLGGAAALVTLATTAGTSIFAIGAFSGIAVLGTFVALMLSRGVKEEAADFYEQEIQAGQILVTVESHGEDASQLLTRADEIFSQHGAKTFDLEED
ncbi:MAG: hypothetical protein HUJ26_21700 [Planctomycetaceae bacterium]|nr:hypothetical protein [Planctomycetaceae bacterium]